MSNYFEPVITIPYEQYKEMAAKCKIINDRVSYQRYYNGGEVYYNELSETELVKIFKDLFVKSEEENKHLRRYSYLLSGKALSTDEIIAYNKSKG